MLLLISRYEAKWCLRVANRRGGLKVPELEGTLNPDVNLVSLGSPSAESQQLLFFRAELSGNQGAAYNDRRDAI